MTRLTDERKRQIEALLRQGYSVDDVAQMVGERSNGVRGVLSGLRRRGVIHRNAKPGRISEMTKQAGFSNPLPTAALGGTAYTAQPLQPPWTPPNPPQTHSLQPGQAVPPLPVGAVEALMKIWNNPKNLLWYNWFRDRHPEYEGDFADFMSESLEGFFRDRGWQIVITKRENRY